MSVYLQTCGFSDIFLTALLYCRVVFDQGVELVVEEEKEKPDLPSLGGIDEVSTFAEDTPATSRAIFIARMQSAGFTYADDGNGKLKVTEDWNSIKTVEANENSEESEGTP